MPPVPRRSKSRTKAKPKGKGKEKAPRKRTASQRARDKASGKDPDPADFKRIRQNDIAAFFASADSKVKPNFVNYRAELDALPVRQPKTAPDPCGPEGSVIEVVEDVLGSRAFERRQVEAKWTQAVLRWMTSTCRIPYASFLKDEKGVPQLPVPEWEVPPGRWRLPGSVAHTDTTTFCGLIPVHNFEVVPNARGKRQGDNSLSDPDAWKRRSYSWNQRCTDYVMVTSPYLDDYLSMIRGTEDDVHFVLYQSIDLMGTPVADDATLGMHRHSIYRTPSHASDDSDSELYTMFKHPTGRLYTMSIPHEWYAWAGRDRDLTWYALYSDKESLIAQLPGPIKRLIIQMIRGPGKPLSDENSLDARRKRGFVPLSDSPHASRAAASSSSAGNTDETGLRVS